MKFNYLIYIFLLFALIRSEGEKYVSEITYVGNNSFSDNELNKLIKLKSQNLFIRNQFSLKKLNRDKLLLESFFKSNGFLGVQIKSTYEEPFRNYINIHYDISEGSKFYLKNIRCVGNKLFSDSLIYGILKTEKKSGFNASLIRSQLKILKRKYLKNGKINVAIMDEININNTDVEVRINIFEGKTFYINRINVSGLESVKKKNVFRELVFKEGEIYSIDKIDKSRQRIFDSGLFSSVEIINNLLDKDNGLVEIEIKLREYKSSSIEASFGFKELSTFQENLSITGLDANAKWLLGNILRTTSNIEFTGSIATSINLNYFKNNPLIEKNLKIIYRSPWTFYFRIPARIKYFHTEESENYILKRDGITYSLIFNQIKSRYEFNSTLELIRSSDTTYALENKIEPSRWMNLKYYLNNIKNPLNPRGGYYLSMVSTLYGTVLGGERDLIKFESEARRYFKLFGNNIFALRMIFGYIKNLNNTNNLPNGYKFQLGGQTSLRGWSGSQDFDKPYGSIIDLVNAEYRFPLFKKLGGEIFLDAGRLYETISSFTILKQNWNYGVGIVYQSALGPIRIDAGFPFGNLSKPQFHASLLYMF